MSYVVEEYDFYDALKAGIVIVNDKELEIEFTRSVSDSAAIVHTNYGLYFCESFTDDAESTYMRVSPFY